MSILLAAFLLAAAAPTAPVEGSKNPWAPVEFMVGEWVGESDGQPGKGTVKRRYEFVLGDKFLHERNVSTYPPQPKNEKGEVHEHWSLFSFDRARNTIVLRQFHQEGFVNQYAMATGGATGTAIFDSEALENVRPGWKARESYQVVSPDEFVETFELATGAGAYEVYSKTRFTRVSGRQGAETARSLEPFRFLIGEWQAEGGGKPGEARGGFSFAPSLQGRIVVRANFAEYPATAQRPASRHDDLMVLYAAESGALRADYYDSEGHVIRYTASVSAPHALTLVSEVVRGAPRFRLSYELRTDGGLDGRFEMAPPGKPESFAPYLTWTARRKGVAR